MKPHVTPGSISNVSLRAFICFLLLPSGDCGPAAGSERLQLLTGVQRRGHRQGQRRHDDLFPHQWTLEQLTPAEERRRLRFRLLNSWSPSRRWDSRLKRARSPHPLRSYGWFGPNSLCPKEERSNCPRSAIETKDVPSVRKDRFCHL